MDRIEKTEDELNELENTLEGIVIKEMLEKINEIIDWINNQQDLFMLKKSNIFKREIEKEKVSNNGI